MSRGAEFSLSKLNLVPLFHQQHDVTPFYTMKTGNGQQAERDLGGFPVGTLPFYEKEEKWLKRTPEELHQQSSSPFLWLVLLCQTCLKRMEMESKTSHP